MYHLGERTPPSPDTDGLPSQKFSVAYFIIIGEDLSGFLCIVKASLGHWYFHRTGQRPFMTVRFSQHLLLSSWLCSISWILSSDVVSTFTYIEYRCTVWILHLFKKLVFKKLVLRLRAIRWWKYLKFYFLTMKGLPSQFLTKLLLRKLSDFRDQLRWKPREVMMRTW